jgi:hypothetical protein
VLFNLLQQFDVRTIVYTHDDQRWPNVLDRIEGTVVIMIEKDFVSVSTQQIPDEFCPIVACFIHQYFHVLSFRGYG